MAKRGPLPASQGPAQGGNTSGQFYPSRSQLGADFSGLVELIPVDDPRREEGVTSEQFLRSYLGANLGSQKASRLAAGYGDAGKYFKPTQRSEVDLNYGQGFGGEKALPDNIVDFSAVPLTDVPTSSTNYSRPRTVAAGYDPATKTMTVVFRDGTFYNYYEVEETEWSAFYASYSKGAPWLNRGHAQGKNGAAPKQTQDGLFINKPRGYADVGKIDARIVEALYRVARAQQIVKQPKARKGRYAPDRANLPSRPGLRKGRGGGLPSFPGL